MPAPDKPVAALTEGQRARLEEFIEEEEGSLNRYGGWLAMFLTAVAVGVSAFHHLGFAGWQIPMHADWVGIGLIFIALLVHFARVRATAPA